MRAFVPSWFVTLFYIVVFSVNLVIVNTFISADNVPFIDEPLPNSTLSRQSIALAEVWLRVCSNSHQTCQQRTPRSDWLPTRLIDVGNKQREPRLVTAADICQGQQAPKYFALSHRWGTAATVPLTSANIEAFKRRLPMETLSKTFSEAVSVCSFFGGPYIWIDSLCIIQDSREDWIQESER
jgi:hypothetical protein